MQSKEYEQALQKFKNCVHKDQQSYQSDRQQAQYAQIRQIFKSQFQKAFFNIGVINDRMGDIEQACVWYEKALERGIGLDHQTLSNFANVIDWDYVFNQDQKPTYSTVKAACNLSVCYEKLGDRQSSLDILNALKFRLLQNRNLRSEYGVFLEGLSNNLGVVQRRNGQIKQSEDSFKLAISLQNQRTDDDLSTQLRSNYRDTSSPIKQIDQEQLSVATVTARGTNKNHFDHIYRMNLIRFFPVYNLAVSNAKEFKLNDSLEIFKDCLKLLHRMQSLSSQAEQNPNIVYFVNVYQNMALIYEKKLQFKNALFCLNQACQKSQNRNIKLLSLLDRMNKIVSALEHGIISYSNFDQSYYNEQEQDDSLSGMQNDLLSMELKGNEDEFNKCSFDKPIYQVDTFDKEILCQSNPIHSVHTSQPHHSKNQIINLNQTGKPFKSSKYKMMNLPISKKQKSIIDSDSLGQSNWNDQFKNDVKKKRQYFRKGNTTNLPENNNLAVSNNYQKNGTLSNDDCKTQQSISKLRSVNDRLQNQMSASKNHLMQSLETSPQNSPLRDLSPFTQANLSQANGVITHSDQKKDPQENLHMQIQLQNLRPQNLHHYKGDPVASQPQRVSSKKSQKDKSVDSRTRKARQHQYIETSQQRTYSKDASINQSRDITVSIQDDRNQLNSSQKKIPRQKAKITVDKVESNDYQAADTIDLLQMQQMKQQSSQNQLGQQQFSTQLDSKITEPPPESARQEVQESSQNEPKDWFERQNHSDQQGLQKVKTSNFQIEDQNNRTVQIIEADNSKEHQLIDASLKSQEPISSGSNQVVQQQAKLLSPRDSLELNDPIVDSNIQMQEQRRSVRIDDTKSNNHFEENSNSLQKIEKNQLQQTQQRQISSFKQSPGRPILKGQSKKMSESLRQKHRDLEKQETGSSQGLRAKQSDIRARNNSTVNSQQNNTNQLSQLNQLAAKTGGHLQVQKTLSSKNAIKNEKGGSKSNVTTSSANSNDKIQQTFEEYNNSEKMVQEGNIEQAITSKNKILSELRVSLRNKVSKKIKTQQNDKQKRELEQKIALEVAELYYKSKNFKKGLEVVDKILTTTQNLDDNKKIELQLLKGKVLDIQGDYTQAMQLFEKNLKEYTLLVKKKQGEESSEKTTKQIGDLEFRLGWSLIRSKKDVEQGVAKLKEAEKKMPENQDLKVKLAQILFQEQNKLDEAIEYLEAVLKINPENNEALYLFGKICLKQKQFKKAEDLIQKSLDIQNQKKIPLRAGLLFHLGQSQELQSEYDKAIESFKKSLQIDHKHLGSNIHLGNIYQLREENKEALTYFLKSKDLDPTSIIVNFALGKLHHDDRELFGVDHLDKAIGFFKEITTKKNDHYRSIYYLGNCLLRQNQFEEAQKMFSSSLEIKNDYVPAMVGMGNLQFEINESQKAFEMHKRALSLQPKNIDALVGIANACYDLKTMKDATMFYEKALRLSGGAKLPGPPGDVHYNLANAYGNLKETDASIRYYKQSLDLDPKRSECHYNLGNAYYSKLRFIEAKQHFLKAYENSGNNAQGGSKIQASLPDLDRIQNIEVKDLTKMQVDILQNLANTELMMENYREAIKQYHVVEKYLQLQMQQSNVADKERMDEQYEQLLQNLANSYGKIEDLDTSKSYFEKSIALNENNVDSILGLAKIYQKMQKYKLAIDLYDQANKLLPESEKEEPDQASDAMNTPKSEKRSQSSRNSSRSGKRQSLKLKKMQTKREVSVEMLK